MYNKHVHHLLTLCYPVGIVELLVKIFNIPVLIVNSV